MIPSRGVILSRRALSIGSRRLETVSYRSFSASTARNGPPRTTSETLRLGALGSRTNIRPQILRSNSILQNGIAMRFKSTNVQSPDVTLPPTSTLTDTIPSSSQTTPEWASKSSDITLDNAVDLNSIDLHDIPERIGYLKELGLDYGWGPTAFVEFLLEHIHVWSGMPWWGSIITTTLFIRLLFFKLYINAADNAAKMATVQHLTKPLMEKSRAAVGANDTQLAMKYRTETTRINARAGIKVWKSFAPMIQMFTGYGTFIILRAMARLPVPGFENGGALWFQNLAMPDPVFILPIATAGVLHYALRKGGEQGVSTMSAGAMRTLSYVFPAITLLFTWWLPSAVQLSFFVAGVSSYLQGVLFRWAPFRSFAGMAPLPVPQTVSTSPYQPHIITTTATPAGTNGGKWEPPRMGDEGPAPVPKPTILSGIKKEVTGAVSTIKKSGSDAVQRAEEMMGKKTKTDGKMSKQEKKAAEKYEAQRQKEESQRRAQMDAERRARRLAKREGNGE